MGRKVHLSELSINYFKVAVRATDLAVYEANEIDTFAGFRELYVNFDPTRLGCELEGYVQNRLRWSWPRKIEQRIQL